MNELTKTVDGIHVAISEIGRRLADIEDYGKKLNEQVNSIKATLEAHSLQNKMITRKIRELTGHVNEIRGL